VRVKLKASQEMLARFMGVGTQTVNSWESGTRNVPLIAPRYLDDLVDIPELWAARTGIAISAK
jgi:DNA-binding transcriptional regulator YiaG